MGLGRQCDGRPDHPGRLLELALADAVPSRAGAGLSRSGGPGELGGVPLRAGRSRGSSRPVAGPAGDHLGRVLPGLLGRRGVGPSPGGCVLLPPVLRDGRGPGRRGLGPGGRGPIRVGRLVPPGRGGDPGGLGRVRAVGGVEAMAGGGGPGARLDGRGELPGPAEPGAGFARVGLGPGGGRGAGGDRVPGGRPGDPPDLRRPRLDARQAARLLGAGADARLDPDGLPFALDHAAGRRGERADDRLFPVKRVALRDVPGRRLGDLPRLALDALRRRLDPVRRARGVRRLGRGGGLAAVRPRHSRPVGTGGPGVRRATGPGGIDPRRALGGDPVQDIRGSGRRMGELAVAPLGAGGALPADAPVRRGAGLGPPGGRLDGPGVRGDPRALGAARGLVALDVDGAGDLLVAGGAGGLSGRRGVPATPGDRRRR